MFDDKIYLKETVVDNEGSGTERDENVHNEKEVKKWLFVSQCFFLLCVLCDVNNLSQQDEYE